MKFFFKKNNMSNGEIDGMKRLDIGNSIPSIALIDLISVDKSFNKESFLTYVKTVFFSVHEGLKKADMKDIKQYVSASMYINLENQAKKISNMKKVAVSTIKIVKTETTDTYVNVTCQLLIMQYVEQQEAKKVPLAQCSHVYWTFTKNLNWVNTQSNNLTCKNCGAVFDIDQSGQCKYCKMFIYADTIGWYLTNISNEYTISNE